MSQYHEFNEFCILTSEQKNLILLKVSWGYSVSRGNYVSFVRQPRLPQYNIIAPVLSTLSRVLDIFIFYNKTIHFITVLNQSYSKCYADSNGKNRF